MSQQDYELFIEEFYERERNALEYIEECEMRRVLRNDNIIIGALWIIIIVLFVAIVLV